MIDALFLLTVVPVEEGMFKGRLVPSLLSKNARNAYPHVFFLLSTSMMTT
jgi:hypothetical protein